MAVSYKDGIDNVIIFWDDDDGIYTAGQLLTGRIEVTVNETTAFKGVRLKIVGVLRVKWSETEAGNLVIYEEFERTLDEDLEIFTPDLRDRQKRWIFPGIHNYKFEYQLPEDLPASLDESKFGHIEYRSKAVVLVPGRTPIESLEESFSLVSKNPPEDEAKLAAMEGKYDLENVEYGTIGGGLFSKKTKIEIILRLEKSVYKQGQVIKGIVEINCENGKHGATGCALLLVQETVFTCNPGEGSEMKKKEILVMNAAQDETDVKPGGSGTYSLQVKIDKTLPTTWFPHSEYIDCGYFIHAIAKTSKLYDDIVVKLPIVVMYGDEEEFVEDTQVTAVDDNTNDTENVGDVNAVVAVTDLDDEEEIEVEPEEGTDDQNLPGQVEDQGEDEEKEGEEDTEADDNGEEENKEEEEENEADGEDEEGEDEEGSE